MYFITQRTSITTSVTDNEGRKKKRGENKMKQQMKGEKSG